MLQFRIPSAYTNSEYAVGVVGTALSVVGSVPDRDVVVDTTDWLHTYSEAVPSNQQGTRWRPCLAPLPPSLCVCVCVCVWTACCTKAAMWLRCVCLCGQAPGIPGTVA
jgi:hypothetical protein